MTLDEIFRHYGCTTQEELANLLGVTQAAVSQWRKRGAVPALQQVKVEMLTRGKLRADPQLVLGRSAA